MISNLIKAVGVEQPPQRYILANIGNTIKISLTQFVQLGMYELAAEAFCRGSKKQTWPFMVAFTAAFPGLVLIKNH